MILIADSGSTKTSWILTNAKTIIKQISTIGFNPNYYKNNDFENIIKNELLPFLQDIKISNIYFYGAGCSTSTNCTTIKNILSNIFLNATIEINHDLFGAAVALLNNKKGIACILGTGSNSCSWNGQEIIQNVPSVGYLLGDEGSGTHIGKKILKGILENKAPNNIINNFYNYYNTNFDEIITKIYNQPKPNQYISAISIFAKNNIKNDWIKSMIKQSFVDFINNQVAQYHNYSNLKVSFTGSIAYHFSEILTESCTENNIIIGEIMKDPIIGLYNYHSFSNIQKT